MSDDPPVCAYRGCDNPASTVYAGTTPGGHRIGVRVCEQHRLPSDRSPPEQQDATQEEQPATLF